MAVPIRFDPSPKPPVLLEGTRELRLEAEPEPPDEAPCGTEGGLSLSRLAPPADCRAGEADRREAAESASSARGWSERTGAETSLAGVGSAGKPPLEMEFP